MPALRQLPWVITVRGIERGYIMSTSKHFDKLVAVVLALGLLLTVAFMNGEALGIEKIIDEDAEQYEETEYFTANDLNGDWDASGATAYVSLNGGSARVSGNGAYYYNGSIVITGAGYYVFSGTLDNGRIVVDAYDSSKVFIMLDGAEIYCSDDACLRVENAEKVFLTLAEGTENRMESGETYSQTALDDNTGGVIFAHDDLTVNGGGSLNIIANYKHGIDANDDLKITGGTISITCPKDGLHVNDSFRLANASLSIAAGDDGIHSDTDVYLESGLLRITECYEGVEAPVILVAGGDIVIYPTDDGFNANGGGSGGMMGGGFGRRDESADGTFTGGRPDLGEFDGEMPDFSEMFENSEMPEPPDWSDSKGERPKMPEDSERPEMPDMVEIPDMSERPDMGEMPGMSGGQQSGSAAEGEDTETYIRITGGSVLIVNENARDADGLDSNGSIYIEGGTILVSLKGDGSNNAVDYGSENGGVAEISGGSIIACGGSAMAESFDSGSTQPSILYNVSSAIAAGTTVMLEDMEGNVLLTWEVPCSFTSAILSCPDMTLGETYRVVFGDEAEEITLDEVSASYGSVQSSGFGGTMNWGGMGPRGDGMRHGGPPDNGESRGGWGGRRSGDSSENGQTEE